LLTVVTTFSLCQEMKCLILSWHSSDPREAGDASLPKVAAVTPAKAFLQAVPAEVLNPQTALFFLAFMRQFVHPERGSVFFQFAVLGLIFVALSSLYTTFIALSIRPLGRIVKHLSWIGRWQGKIIGSVFIGLGIKVATQHR
jgi:threonine/homoserine/homoserine lactone efflux protein